MAYEFTLPDVGEGVAEGELVSWLVAEGEDVSEDQPVAEVETDKALVEVPAPVDGTVGDLRYAEGDVIPVGEVFVTFDVAGEATADGSTGADADDGTVGADADDGTVGADANDGTAGEETAADEAVSTPEGRVFAPPHVRRLAREAGVDLAEIQGSGPGGRITAGDVRFAADVTDGETPRTTAAGTADDAGPEPTDDAGTSGSDSAVATTPGADVSGAADRDRTLAAPATRRLAQEEGIDIDAVPAVEDRDGEAFVTPEAVREYADAQRRAQEADAAAIAEGRATDRERREPFRGVRRRIAEAMVESKYTAPHVTHHDEVDVTDLVETRERLKPVADERGIRLTYTPFVVMAVVAALREFPEMNAVIDDDTEEIVYREYYNVGIATATEAGLMVPVVEDADEKGLLDLASEMNELAEKARERSIAPAELRGSTFTVTNVGGIGGEYATPILNYPESGILAVGEIKRKPRVVVDDDGTESIEPRHVLSLSLSFDHRLIDGAIGARFTNEVMRYLADPRLLLLE